MIRANDKLGRFKVGSRHEKSTYHSSDIHCVSCCKSPLQGSKILTSSRKAETIPWPGFEAVPCLFGSHMRPCRM